MVGGIVQLVAINNQNVYFPLSYSLTLNEYVCTANSDITIVRTADTEYWDGLVVNGDDITKIPSFSVRIGLNMIWEVPFRLIMKISKIKRNGNNCIIKFPQNLLADPEFEIFLISLPHCMIYVSLGNDKLFNYRLVTKQKFLDTEPRRKMAQSQHEVAITQYRELKLKSGEYEDVNIDQLCCGFFIETLSLVSEYSLCVGDKEHAHWTGDDILANNNLVHKCVSGDKEEYLYWFPICPGKMHYDDSTSDAINLAQSKLCVKCVGEYIVYARVKSVLRYEDGIGTISPQ